jgi:hypothetical protein
MNNSKIADSIVSAILRDLKDRRGLRHAWERIDEDIQLEIENAWKEIILDGLRKVENT